jgi:hypothetical protein
MKIPEYLYVCHFSNGHIKVGRSIDPLARISSHVERVSCLGVTLVAHQTFLVASFCDGAEAALIELCSENAQTRNKSEWFVGLAYEVVCEWATECASRIYIVEPASKLKSYFLGLDKFDRIAFAIDAKTSVGHLNNCAYGYILPNVALCVRIEQVSKGAVTRKDMRADYAALWPELTTKATP